MTTRHPSPQLSPDEAVAIARELYGLNAEARPLPSHDDQNFHLRTAEGDWVLRVTDGEASRERLEMQLLALEYLSERLDQQVVPRPRRSLSDARLTALERPDGRRQWVHLVSFLDGRMMADVRPHSTDFLESVGRLVATVDRHLADFSHPAVDRDLLWDLRLAGRLLPDAGEILPPRRRMLAERYLADFESRVLPLLRRLQEAVIHNDANDYNVLVSDGGSPRASGLIDFEDMISTPRVFGLAVAAAYATLAARDPLSAAASVVAGYHRVWPLDDLEISVLFPALRARLAVSVTVSYREQRRRPDNVYLTVSENPAWEAMERLAGVDPEQARARFGAACGREGSATGAARSGRSAEEILAARRRHLGPSLSLSYRRPLQIVRGWMQYLFDERGLPYLDGVNNVCHVGHCHPRVVEAARRQMELLNTNTRYLHHHLVGYAERLTATLPEPLSVCFFVCSGSEANELALRMACAHTGKAGAVVVDGAYHGNTGRVIELSPYKFDGPGGQGRSDAVRVVTMPDGYRQRHKHADPEAGRKYADEVAAAVADLEGTPHGLAAFFCESLLSCGGQVIPADGYLEHAFRHVRAAGGVCVADEVQVGFGRVGSHFWAFETQGVVPDVVTLGKPIGNGHPLAAVVTTPEIAASFANGMEYFSTFGGNPVSCAVGLAVLDAIEEEGLQVHALAVGGRLKAGLAGLQDRHPLVGEVRGLGLFLGIELVRDRDTLEPAADEASEVIERVKERGILLSTDGPLHNVIKIKPPLPFADENAEQLVAALDEALAEVERHME